LVLGIVDPSDFPSDGIFRTFHGFLPVVSKLILTVIYDVAFPASTIILCLSHIVIGGSLACHVRTDILDLVAPESSWKLCFGFTKRKKWLQLPGWEYNEQYYSYYRYAVAGREGQLRNQSHRRLSIGCEVEKLRYKKTVEITIFMVKICCDEDEAVWCRKWREFRKKGIFSRSRSYAELRAATMLLQLSVRKIRNFS
jgi:hypothetical protein